jgi:hypothetical protein
MGVAWAAMAHKARAHSAIRLERSFMSLRGNPLRFAGKNETPQAHPGARELRHQRISQIQAATVRDSLRSFCPGG